MTTSLKPGLLVSLNTRCRGGVEYIKEDLGKDIDGRQETAEWKTQRTIADRMEFDAARKAQSAMSAAVRRYCCKTPFGLLCPTERQDQLNEGVREAEEIRDNFNRTARFSSLRLVVMVGRIEATDEIAARRIAAEIRDLLSQMDNAVRRMDVDSIREAADAAKELEDMLEERQGQVLGEAIKAARSAAREMVREAKKNAGKLEAVMLKTSTAPIQSARFAFLDTSETKSVEATASVDESRFAGVE